ncbi:17229_t:CDS:2 [Racocetra fulgida]|uniref:17229_t:CDS:1 n=1 Tax=Racocetra fulgida TaxID=60492 RepID=A0A9N8VB47_9GLOM|nr:17229_t:CDS:2 [Racocetra fulgida]
MHYVTDSAVEEDEEKNIYLGNIFCLRTDLANIYHANELAKRLKENKADAKDKEQLEKFKNEVDNEAKQVKPLIAYLTNEQVADQIDTTTLKGEKQNNGHDCGVYLCLYIKELMEFETRQDNSTQTLALTRKYGAEIIEEFQAEADANSSPSASQYPKLIEDALKQGNEAINSPYTLKLLPLVKKLLEPNPSTTTGLGTDGHICPYLELPKVEEKFRQQFQGEIKDLKNSERTNNLSELNQKLSDETYAKNDYLNQLNQSQNEIKRLEEELANERNLKENWHRECGKIMEMLGNSNHPINNLSHLASLLQGKNLYQIIEANRNLRDAINSLIRQHQVNSLEELSQKIIRTEQELANELNSLNIQLRRSRINIKAIYEYYITKKGSKLDTDDKSIKVLEDKILTLIGQDFDSEQIIGLRDLFVYNGLPNTYNFIEEVTSLTNNHKIKSLENEAKALKLDLEQNIPEELEEKVNKISPLLLTSALPETQQFIENGILEKNKKLEDALNEVGIDPNDADVGKKIAMLKGLEERVIELYGKDYKEILKVQE